MGNYRYHEQQIKCSLTVHVNVNSKIQRVVQKQINNPNFKKNNCSTDSTDLLKDLFWLWIILTFVGGAIFGGLFYAYDPCGACSWCLGICCRCCEPKRNPDGILF